MTIIASSWEMVPAHRLVTALLHDSSADLWIKFGGRKFCEEPTLGMAYEDWWKDVV